MSNYTKHLDQLIQLMDQISRSDDAGKAKYRTSKYIHLPPQLVSE